MKNLGVIEIPNALNSEFDHAAFDPRTRRVFIAHTARDCIEVIDHDTQKHIATLPGFPGVAGAVADDGEILTTNRGGATITWLDAATYKIKAVYPSGPRPNGAAIVKRMGVGIAACIGDVEQGPTLQIINLKEVTQRAIKLPEQLVDMLAHQIEKQLLLGADVIVERSRLDADLGGELAQAHGFVPVLEDQAQSGLADRLHRLRAI